jgi:spore protease
MKGRITDLACEMLRRRPKYEDGVSVSVKRMGGVKTTTTKILSASAASEIGKPCGIYINIETKANSTPEHTVTAIASAVNGQIKRAEKILVVGLGNDRFIADSLGPKVLRYINTNENLMTFEPNVSGITGINSVDAIKAISRLAKPTLVIVIDSLVAADASRIGTNYQIADSGITPGSGIGRDNKRIDRQFLGVPVIAIGIPVCTIITTKIGRIMHLMPKNIDAVVEESSLVIAAAIGTLT